MRRLVLLFAMTLLSVVSLALLSAAATQKFAVGSCEPKLTSFNTISQAVSSVPSGATVLVCPGNYAEQVVILQPLTLQGVLIGGANAAVITAPPGGIQQNAGSYGAQLAVEDTGPVNINDIAVDGTNGSNTCAFKVLGVYYQSSSGSINHVVVRNQTAGGCGSAVWLENDSASSSPTITVQNSSIHSFDFAGIFGTLGPGASAMVVNVLSNSVISGPNGIFLDTGVTGSILSNTLDVVGNSIGVQGGSTTVKLNRISSTGQAIGIFSDGNQILSNSIFNAGTFGIAVLGNSNLIQANSITYSGSAVGVYCIGASLNAITGNKINDASTGIANTGSVGNTITPNTLYNVASAIGPCV